MKQILNHYSEIVSLLSQSGDSPQLVANLIGQAPLHIGLVITIKQPLGPRYNPFNVNLSGLHIKQAVV